MATTTTKPGSAQDTARTSIGLIGTGQQGTASTKARQEALIRQLKAEYGIQVTEKMADAIGKVFDNMIGKENDAADMILKMANGQVTQRQGLQADQARLAMNIMAGPEQTKAHIAGLAVGFATICRLFGADDLAEMVESKAKDILSTVKVRLNTDEIEDGLTTALKAKGNALSSLNGMGAARDAADGAKRTINDMDGITPSVHSVYPDASQAGSKKGVQLVTWGQLEQSAKEAGLTDAGLAALRRSFDRTKDLVTSDGKVGNGSERQQLFAAAAKEITTPTELQKVDTALRNLMGPIETQATRGPR